MTSSVAQIGFGLVRHTRLRPRSHAFSYPAYFLRVPVRHLAQALDGIRLCSLNRWNLFSFSESDYGPQGASAAPGGLSGWIDDLLMAHGIGDAGGEIWLQTFPRVLGFVFNPVSFWYCHRIDGSLRAIVCEVTNTFGERHCYLLDRPDGQTIRQGQELRAQKVFHVSPFCKIEGEYRFRFLDARGQSVARVDYDDASGPLLLTSISGVHQRLHDAALLRAFFLFPLFTFGVVARIHLQALRLWLKRIPFIPKPSPPATEVSR